MKFKLNQLFFLPILLSAFALSSRTVIAREITGTNVFQHKLEKLNQKSQSFTLPDMDGDNIPESATVNSEGKIHNITIHLSQTKKNILFTFTSTELDFILYAYDVNHDKNQDIVIASAKSLNPIAVYLNNGQGEFEETSFWWCTNLDRRILSDLPWTAFNSKKGSTIFNYALLSKESFLTLPLIHNGVRKLASSQFRRRQTVLANCSFIYNQLKARSPPLQFLS